MNFPPATHPVWELAASVLRFGALAVLVKLTSHQFSADEMVMLLGYLFVSMGIDGTRAKVLKKSASKNGP